MTPNLAVTEQRWVWQHGIIWARRDVSVPCRGTQTPLLLQVQLSPAHQIPHVLDTITSALLSEAPTTSRQLSGEKKTLRGR